MHRSQRLIIAVILILALMAPNLAYARPIGPDKPAAPAASSWKDSTEVSTQKNGLPDRARAIASDAPVRVIIQLSAPPLAHYQGGIAGLAPAGMNIKNTKMEVHSPAAEAYVDYLAQEQSKFAAALIQLAPAAQVQYNYRITYNGLAARVPGSSIPTIEKLAGVRRVTLARQYFLDMDASIPQIGLYDGFFNGTNPGVDMGLWKQLGGHANAGAGIKVAMLDTGIDQTHPFFDPTGFSYPSDDPYITYPRGETAYTTPKVIAAHVYLRPDDPADAAYDCACPQDYIGHGSHTSGTVAGNFNTPTDYDNTPLSGVAPKAWLMNYKIFYHSDSGLESGETPEILMAYEDAVSDGADVVSNSWGGGDLDYAGDPLITAGEAMVDMGIVMVFSAGNEGPSANSLGEPGVGEQFITVGASTTNRVFALPVSVTAPAPVPSNLVNIAGVVSSGPLITTTLEGPYVDSGAAGDLLGCTGFAGGAFTGKIALIKRGTCAFADKVSNALAAGAVGVVVWNNVPGPAISMGSLESTTIPSVMVDNTDGQNLQVYSLANPATAALRIDTDLARLTKAQWADQVASFSSRGPNPVNLIKPDLVAPGVNILSSVPWGYDLYQGTSMAAPHVSGVAALVRQAHPTWTPQQIKSAIVNTTRLPASLDASCTNLVGAYPGPMCRGSGRLWAGSFGAGDPGLLLDPVSISLGALYKPVGSSTVINIPIDVRSVVTYTANGTVSVTPGVGSAAFTVTPSTYSFGLAGNASTVLTATFTLGTAITPGDYWGQINLTFGQSGYYNLHIPYWVRVLPFTDLGAADVLLIDDDASTCSAGWCGQTYLDFRSYYTSTLDSLGISYKVLNLDYSGGALTCAAPWDVARQYDKVIWFTGNAPGYLFWCDYGISAPNITGMNRLMSSGTKMLASGQDFAAGLADSVWGDDRNLDLQTYFGATYIQDNVFWNTPIPVPSADAVDGVNPFLAGVKINFNSTANGGAHNQNYVDELAADTAGAALNGWDALPLFRAALQSDNASDAMVGTRISSEPTIERVRGNPRTLWTTLGYRSILLSFGLEAVGQNVAAGPDYGVLTNRRTLMLSLLNWLDDEVTFSSFEVEQAGQIVDTNASVHATAQAISSMFGSGLNTPSVSDGIVSYRWDWGDGNTPVTTATGSASHGYARPGVYQVRVEAMDFYGHKVVSDPIPVIVDIHSVFVPVVVR